LTIYEYGIYHDTITNHDGCDSILILKLSPLSKCCDTAYSTTDTTFLYDDLVAHPFRWFNKEYAQPGVYRDTILTTQGCDSIGSLILRVIYEDSLRVCDDEQVTFHTPWGDYASRPDCDCLTGYPMQTSDGEWLVEATLCVNRLACECDTAYSITYKEIRDDELPTFQWNNIPMTVMPQNEQRDTTLVFPTMKMDASCDSIATLRLHVLVPCEMPSTPYPAYWREPQSMHY
ncbi:MAG: hypothetical protein KBS69_03755, partial [Bacteroidales bacterium]|nr:hypothetical protein [Candidatus Colicola caccequi]